METVPPLPPDYSPETERILQFLCELEAELLDVVERPYKCPTIQTNAVMRLEVTISKLMYELGL